MRTKKSQTLVRQDGKRLLTPEEARKYYGVSRRTLYNWEQRGQVECDRKGPRGVRRFLVPDLSSKPLRRRVCYCRVSSAGQKEDLERQVAFLRERFPEFEVVKDIGSGLSCKRRGLQALLESIVRGEVEELVVTHRDRLARFGVEFWEQLLSLRDGKLVVLDQRETSPKQELVNDLLSIVTSFSGRLYGLRAHQFRKALRSHAQNSSLSNSCGENAAGGALPTTEMVL